MYIPLLVLQPAALTSRSKRVLRIVDDIEYEQVFVERLLCRRIGNVIVLSIFGAMPWKYHYQNRCLRGLAQDLGSGNHAGLPCILCIVQFLYNLLALRMNASLDVKYVVLCHAV